MRFKNLQINKSKEKKTGDDSTEDIELSNKISSLEEQVSHKTRELEAAKQKLKELSDAVQAYENEEDTTPQPHGPLGELTVEPEEAQLDDEADAALFEETDEEVPVIEVVKAETAVVTKAEKTTPAETETEEIKENAAAPADDSLSSLFSDQEEEENPLASLINSIPDVTAQELLDDIQEIKGIMKELRH